MEPASAAIEPASAAMDPASAHIEPASAAKDPASADMEPASAEIPEREAIKAFFAAARVVIKLFFSISVSSIFQSFSIFC
jgi:hypothetical protein